MRGFPEGMRKILFDPDNQFAGRMRRSSSTAASSWAAISADIAREQR